MRDGPIGLETRMRRSVANSLSWMAADDGARLQVAALKRTYSDPKRATVTRERLCIPVTGAMHIIRVTITLMHPRMTAAGPHGGMAWSGCFRAYS